MASTYTWNGGSSRWNNGLNWTDVTAPGAGTAPMAGDIATIGADAINLGVDLIEGSGAAALLTVDGTIDITGSLDLGTLDVDHGVVLITSGGIVNAGSLTLAALVSLDGGTLDVGTLTLSAVLNVNDRARLHVAAVTSSMNGEVVVDATSSAEFGTAGLGTAGTIAVDPGVTLSAAALSGAVLDDGVLLAAPNLSISGTIGGTGLLSFGTSGYTTVTLAADVGAGIGVAFGAPNQTLQINTYGTTARSFAIAAPISGFGAGDFISDIAASAVAASYAATGAGVGTLAFTAADGSVVQSLTLLGDYSHDTFAFIPVAGLGGMVGLAATTSLPAPQPAPTNPGTDAYSWNVGTSGGLWGVAANWTDTTTGVTGPLVPGANNAASLVGARSNGASPPVVVGDGQAASLTTAGALALDGSFTTDTLVAGSPTSLIYALLDLLPGSTLDTGLAGLYGSVELDGGTIVASSTLTLGSTLSNTSLTLTGGAKVTAASFEVTDATITIDPTSRLGDPGLSASGALTLNDAGADTFTNVTLSGLLVNNTDLTVNSTSLATPDVFNGPITGAGMITLAPSTNGYVAFEGPTGQLQSISVSAGWTLDITAGAAFDAFLTGLVPSDALLVPSNVVGAVLNAGSVTLTDASGATVANIQGDFTSAFGTDRFVLLPNTQTHAGPAGGLANELLLVSGTLESGPPPAPAPGSANGQSFAWAGAGGGAWNDAANWNGVVTPGSLDTADLDTTSGVGHVITGSGRAATATATGATVLSGDFGFGTLAITQSATALGLIDVVAGSTLDAGSVTMTGGTLDAVGAGAAIAVSGTITADLNTFTANLNAAQGASVQAGAIADQALSTSLIGTLDISVDGTSRLEVGTAGNAARGLLTVDAGAALTITGGEYGALHIAAAVQNDGVIGNASTSPGTVFQETTIDGPVSGSGTLLVGRGAMFLEGPVAGSQTIAFTGAASLLLEQPTAADIVGFARGDTFVIGGVMTTTSYVATSATTGLLTLSGAGGATTTLHLTGSYDPTSFVALAGAGLGLTNDTFVTFAAPLAADTLPAISGTLAGQAVSDAATIAPFAGVSLTDPNAVQNETLSVLVTPGNTADGALSDPNAGTDGSRIVGGAVELTGTAAQVTAAVDGLVFTPTPHQVDPGQTVTTGFTLDLFNTATGFKIASDGNTSVVATALVYDVPQLTQIYTDELGRAPSADELDGLDHDLNTGYTLADLRDAVAMSQEGQNALAQIYATELGRQPSAGELSELTSDEQNGYSLASIRVATAAMPESQAEQMLVYADELGRLPTQAELSATTQELAQGLSLAGLEAMTAMLPEAQAALGQLYLATIGRAPTAGELATSTTELGAGTTLDQIRSSVAGSPEGQNALAQVYASVLGRQPSAGELSLLTTDAQNGLSLAAIRAATAATPESQKEQKLVYADELGRLPTPTELAATTQALAQGLSLGGLEAATAMLPEAQAALEQVYLAVLGRVPGAAEQATLTTDLGTGYTLAQIRSAAAASPEAQTALSSVYQGVLARVPTAAEQQMLTGELESGSTLDAIRAAAAQGPEGQQDVATLIFSTLGTMPTMAQIADATVQLASGIGQAALVAQLVGLSGNPTISSDATSTTLAGTPGVDVFSVGAGAADVITGFDLAHDILQVGRAQVADYASFIADLSTTAGGALLTLDATHSVLLQGVAAAAIGAANVRFV